MAIDAESAVRARPLFQYPEEKLPASITMGAMPSRVLTPFNTRVGGY
jgi:hypothetical protein